MGAIRKFSLAAALLAVSSSAYAQERLINSPAVYVGEMAYVSEIAAECEFAITREAEQLIRTTKKSKGPLFQAGYKEASRTNYDNGENSCGEERIKSFFNHPKIYRAIGLKRPPFVNH